ncbi:MAG: hypothetical protein GTO03_02605 [Planctomycetales bacterium]|nr:hypothetical protein [Planctomycetales bacterium]
MLEPNALIQLFYDHPQDLGDFRKVEPGDLPAEYRRLLVHQQHMTVAMEAFHDSLVDLEVLQLHQTETHYARQILLRRRRDGAVVQFGIMRVALTCLSDSIREEIEAQRQPLGRILCLHDVLRTVRLDGLWRVEPRGELCRLFEMDPPRTTYGRTAGIDLNGQPAIEVLEIPAPLDV